MTKETQPWMFTARRSASDPHSWLKATYKIVISAFVSACVFGSIGSRAEKTEQIPQQLHEVRSLLSTPPDAGEIVFSKNDSSGRPTVYYWAVWQGDDFVLKQLQSAMGTNQPDKSPFESIWGLVGNKWWQCFGGTLRSYTDTGANDSNNTVVASVGAASGNLRQALFFGVQLQRGSLTWSGQSFEARSDDDNLLQGELLSEGDVFLGLRVWTESVPDFVMSCEYHRSSGAIGLIYPCSILRYAENPSTKNKLLKDRIDVFQARFFTNAVSDVVFSPSRYITRENATQAVIYKMGSVYVAGNTLTEIAQVNSTRRSSEIRLLVNLLMAASVVLLIVAVLKSIKKSRRNQKEQK